MGDNAVMLVRKCFQIVSKMSIITYYVGTALL